MHLCYFNLIFFTDCGIIYILPEKVEQDDDGQYFAFEEYYLEDENRLKLFENFADILLKLHCYYNFEVSFKDNCFTNPLPKLLYSQIVACAKERTYMNIIIEKQNAMIIVNGDDLYFSVYNPNLKMQKLLRELLKTAGLFFRKSTHEDIHDFITKELLENKSVSAFIWLINKGRELEFSYHDTNCFVSKNNSISDVSLWIEDFEQGFTSVEMLWNDALIGGDTLKNVWSKVTFTTLF